LASRVEFLEQIFRDQSYYPIYVSFSQALIRELEVFSALNNPGEIHKNWHRANQGMEEVEPQQAPMLAYAYS
jgi:hypothetical protein